MLAAPLRLAELLAALSVITDIGTGQPTEKAVRACVLATGLAQHLDATSGELSDVYYTSLLRHLGCTATAHDEAYLFGGDELVSRPPGERTDFGNPREMMTLLLATGKGSGIERPKYLARALRAGKKADALIFGSICEVAAQLAVRLGMSPGVVTGVAQVFERWDGKGGPQGLAGGDIALPARLAELAHQVVIFERLGGIDAAKSMARRRAGAWFDPELCELFDQHGSELLDELNSLDVWERVVEIEPEPVRNIPELRIDDVAHAFADMIDLKAPFFLGHSSAVAGLAEAAATGLGLGRDSVTTVRRSGFLHDVGRAGVSNGVWERRGPLTSLDWEGVRLHPYFTERILSRSVALAPLAQIAGMHHERQDGSGYHRRAASREIRIEARLLAAADSYQAMTQDRPHRRALDPGDAADALRAEVRDGRLDAECAKAVLDAAGQGGRVKTSWPSGLTGREVEVLRLVAAGLSNRKIAEQLFVSPRTAEHHVQHIYDKIGTSTRAGAAMYAMEHDLISPPRP